MDDDHLPKYTEQKLIEAFDLKLPSYRTLGAVAREIGIPESSVRTYIEQHREEFEVAPIKPGGEELFRTVSSAGGYESSAE